jgi:hypothetical protein
MSTIITFSTFLLLLLFDKNVTFSTFLLLLLFGNSVTESFFKEKLKLIKLKQE